ncbi:MAG: FtsX-like permease family protein [Angustibacter sp.]
MTGSRWRLAFRLARRDLRHSRGRNALVLAMVGLPVLLVTVLATLSDTLDVTPREGLTQALGQTEALVAPQGRDPIDQDPTGTVSLPSGDPSAWAEEGRPWTAAEIARVVGGRVIDVMTSESSARTDRGRIAFHVVGVDAADPLLAGFVEVREGRVPRADDEVVVSGWLADRGYGIGRSLDLDGGSVRVVGIGWAPSLGIERQVLARPGSRAVTASTPDPEQAQHSYLVTGTGPITWPRVRELNEQGLFVKSRAVIENPPVDWRASLDNPSLASWEESSQTELAVVLVVVFAVVLEVMLLAGAAFAVGVKRQQRALALLAATGGKPRDVRRVVLAQGLVSGAVAAVAGAVIGVPVALVVARGSTAIWPEAALWGPFDVHWTAVAVAAAVGAVAAMGAAFFPARSVARNDVAAVLAGRRGQLRSRTGLPVLGAVGLAAGAGLALVMGRRANGEVWIGIAMIVLVLSAVVALPAVVGSVGRLGRLLPLPLRLALRDSSRQRSRTAPAVAAVMAAVFGATVLAIGSASDDALSRKKYQPQLPMGVTSIEAFGEGAAWWKVTTSQVRRIVGRDVLLTGELGRSEPEVSGSPTDAVDGSLMFTTYVATGSCPSDPRRLLALDVKAETQCRFWAQTGIDQRLGAQDTLVATTETLQVMGFQLDKRQLAVLRDGGVLVPNRRLVGKGRAVQISTFREDDETITDVRTVRLPAAVLPTSATGPQGDFTAIGAVVTPQTADRKLGGWRPAKGLIAAGDAPVSSAQREELEEVLSGSASGMGMVIVDVERGYESPLSLILLVLAVIAGLVVLVATLTATGLALVDSRADAATLAAVGARPRTRRVMAAAQAVVIGLLGTLAGIAVGFVPGVALTWPLTAVRRVVNGTEVWTSPTVEIPWLALAVLAVGVPVLAAAIAGLFVRTRLQLTRRLAQ